MAEFAQILIRAKDETKTAFDSAARNMRGLEASAAKLGGLLRTVGLGAGISVAGFAAFAKTGIDAADALQDMSDRLGVSVKDLAGFKLAAQLADTSLEGVGNGISRLSRSIGEAEGGNKKLAETLRTLGITARDPKEAFFQLADATQRIQDPAQRAALLSQVLGKSYQELVPLLNQGGDALRNSARESESFADAMARLAPNAGRFNDELDRMRQEAAGASAAILERLVPGLADTATRVRELLDDDKGVQALVRAFAGLGKLPWDALIGDPFKPAETASQRIKELKSELSVLQSDLKSAQTGGKSSVVMRAIFGSPEEITRQIVVIQNQITALEKFGEKVYKPKAAPTVASAGGGIDTSAAFKPSVKAIDFESMRVADIADAWKLADEELKRYAEDQAFVLQGDLERDNAVTALAQEWKDAGRALKQDMMTPLEKFDGRLEYINELWRIGAIDIETYDRAMASAFDDAGAKIEQTNGMAREFGLTMQSAFEDAVIGGEDFRDILGGIGSDLQRMVLRKTITEPLGNAVSGFIDGIDFGSMFGFANGGVMTASGPLPLHAYASGGVASSPQLALFGEGRTNEAFVPLPDGRRIPVDMRGGGGNVQVNIIESPGNGGKTERRQDGNGGNVLDIYVEQIKASIAGDISRGRGAVPDALAGTYGLNRVAGAY